jgi:hypothetical protein
MLLSMYFGLFVDQLHIYNIPSATSATAKNKSSSLPDMKLVEVLKLNTLQDCYNYFKKKGEQFWTGQAKQQTNQLSYHDNDEHEGEVEHCAYCDTIIFEDAEMDSHHALDCYHYICTSCFTKQFKDNNNNNNNNTDDESQVCRLCLLGEKDEDNLAKVWQEKDFSQCELSAKFAWVCCLAS